MNLEVAHTTGARCYVVITTLRWYRFRLSSRGRRETLAADGEALRDVGPRGVSLMLWRPTTICVRRWVKPLVSTTDG
jgi:hypothetical protein